jgi:two-component system cell cycle sensor histidine kinase/response regulator CckA
MNNGSAYYALEDPQETIRLLEEELAQTNREVMALTVELEKRVDQRTAELRSTKNQLERSNAQLLQLTAELERRVAARTLELEEAVEQLRAAEQRYRRLAENAPDIIFRYEVEPNAGFTFMSPLVQPITGYAPEEFYADSDLGFRIVHPDDRASLDAVLRGESPASRVSALRLMHKNGTVVWIEQHHSLVHHRDGGIAAIECIARDVSDRKLLEEQFRQAQKMEAVGRLAGGIAHDFNNLLTVINGYSSLALEELDSADPLYTSIGEVNKAGERAAGLTRQLLAFSRRQVLTVQVLDLNSVVADVDRMLRRVLGEDIQYGTAPAPALHSVRADRGQIEQVIMNLAVNARDAMPDGGRLMIETANVELDENYAAQHSEVTPGDYVMLAVTDTGHGIDAATLSRIFEPFFTTKPQGRGTGLGLATVYGIVKQSGGSIGVYSEPGQGTTFKIYLPRVNAPPERVERRPAARQITGSGTVLVVEDEESVRALILTVLKQAGYRILEARDGAEALAICDRHQGTIHLVITDIVMPEVSGRELAERVKTKRPEVKLLFMSGYTDNAMVQQGTLESDMPFLQKPFTPGALAGKVKALLEG